MSCKKRLKQSQQREPVGELDLEFVWDERNVVEMRWAFDVDNENRESSKISGSERNVFVEVVVRTKSKEKIFVQKLVERSMWSKTGVDIEELDVFRVVSVLKRGDETRKGNISGYIGKGELGKRAHFVIRKGKQRRQFLGKILKARGLQNDSLRKRSKQVNKGDGNIRMDESEPDETFSY